MRERIMGHGAYRLGRASPSLEPWTQPPGSTPYVNPYSAALFRVQMRVVGPPMMDHATGAGHSMITSADEVS